MLSISMEEFKKLRPLSLSKKNISCESILYVYNNNLLIKYYYERNGLYSSNKKLTAYYLDCVRELLTKNFCLPEDIVKVDNKFVGLLLPKINGYTLRDILDNPNIHFKKKLTLLAKVGEELNKMDSLRENKRLKNFYIGDLHSSNCMVDDKDEIVFIDLDSCRIGNNVTSPSLYLATSFFIKSMAEKYPNSPHNDLTNVDRNTDLLCYNMMILEFISGTKMIGESKKKFNQYILDIEKLDIEPKLINSFKRITSVLDNVNPYDSLMSLTEDQVEACKKVRTKNRILF